MTIDTAYDIADGRVFENPSNGHREYVGITTTLGMFFFGGLYLIYKGIWTHAVASFLAILVLLLLHSALHSWSEMPVALIGIVLIWLGYTFAARGIVSASYLRKGWAEVSHEYPRDGRAPEPYEPVDERPQVDSVADELAKLAALLEAGHLTQQEFDDQKSRLLK